MPSLFVLVPSSRYDNLHLSLVPTKTLYDGHDERWVSERQSTPRAVALIGQNPADVPQLLPFAPQHEYPVQNGLVGGFEGLRKQVGEPLALRLCWRRLL